jgi:6-phosphogluconate dehydrogenase
VTETRSRKLLELGDSGDSIVDGGNSNFRDSSAGTESEGERHPFRRRRRLGRDLGTENGYCLMVGGDEEPVQRLEPIFTALAPENGYAHVGASGGGHFVKWCTTGSNTAHAGIRRGLRGDGEVGVRPRPHEIAGIWRYGSVVRSWLLELLRDALEKGGNDLPHIKGYVEDSGEGAGRSTRRSPRTCPCR